jgi:hypothetical protein
MPNSYVIFVKKYAKDNSIKYGEALKQSKDAWKKHKESNGITTKTKAKPKEKTTKITKAELKKISELKNIVRLAEKDSQYQVSRLEQEKEKKLVKKLTEGNIPMEDRISDLQLLGYSLADAKKVASAQSIKAKARAKLMGGNLSVPKENLQMKIESIKFGDQKKQRQKMVKEFTKLNKDIRDKLNNGTAIRKDLDDFNFVAKTLKGDSKTNRYAKLINKYEKEFLSKKYSITQTKTTKAELREISKQKNIEVQTKREEGFASKRGEVQAQRKVLQLRVGQLKRMGATEEEAEVIAKEEERQKREQADIDKELSIYKHRSGAKSTGIDYTAFIKKLAREKNVSYETAQKLSASGNLYKKQLIKDLKANTSVYSKPMVSTKSSLLTNLSNASNPLLQTINQRQKYLKKDGSLKVPQQKQIENIFNLLGKDNASKRSNVPTELHKLVDEKLSTAKKLLLQLEILKTLPSSAVPQNELDRLNTISNQLESYMDNDYQTITGKPPTITIKINKKLPTTTTPTPTTPTPTTTTTTATPTPTPTPTTPTPTKKKKFKVNTPTPTPTPLPTSIATLDDLLMKFGFNSTAEKNLVKGFITTDLRLMEASGLKVGSNSIIAKSLIKRLKSAVKEGNKLNLQKKGGDPTISLEVNKLIGYLSSSKVGDKLVRFDNNQPIYEQQGKGKGKGKTQADIEKEAEEAIDDMIDTATKGNIKQYQDILKNDEWSGDKLSASSRTKMIELVNKLEREIALDTPIPLGTLDAKERQKVIETIGTHTLEEMMNDLLENVESGLVNKDDYTNQELYNQLKDDIDALTTLKDPVSGQRYLLETTDKTNLTNEIDEYEDSLEEELEKIRVGDGGSGAGFDFGRKMKEIKTTHNKFFRAIQGLKARGTKTKSQGAIDSEDKKFLDMSDNAYKPVEDRQHKIYGYVYNKNASNEEHAIYVNQNEKKIAIAFRGSQTKEDWTKSDTNLAIGKLKQTPRFGREEKWVQEIKSMLPNYEYVYTGHSLGGTLAIEMGDLFKEPAITFNAGHGVGMGDKKDNDVKFYSAKGDAVSSLGVGQYKDTRLIENTAGNSITAHSLDSFKGKSEDGFASNETSQDVDVNPKQSEVMDKPIASTNDDPQGILQNKNNKDIPTFETGDNQPTSPLPTQLEVAQKDLSLGTLDARDVNSATDDWGVGGAFMNLVQKKSEKTIDDLNKLHKEFSQSSIKDKVNSFKTLHEYKQYKDDLHDKINSLLTDIHELKNHNNRIVDKEIKSTMVKHIKQLELEVHYARKNITPLLSHSIEQKFSNRLNHDNRSLTDIVVKGKDSIRDKIKEKEDAEKEIGGGFKINPQWGVNPNAGLFVKTQGNLGASVRKGVSSAYNEGSWWEKALMKLVGYKGGSLITKIQGGSLSNDDHKDITHATGMPLNELHKHFGGRNGLQQRLNEFLGMSDNSNENEN